MTQDVLLFPLLFTRNERLTYHIAAQIASLRSSSSIGASSPRRILCSLAAAATVLDEDDGDEEWSRSRPAASAGDADAAMAAAAAPRAAAPSRRFNPLPIILICLHWWSFVVWWSGNTSIINWCGPVRRRPATPTTQSQTGKINDAGMPETIAKSSICKSSSVVINFAQPNFLVPGIDRGKAHCYGF